MVALDHSDAFDSRRGGLRGFAFPALTQAWAIGLAALGLALAILAARGFSDNGLRFAIQTVWRFNLLVFTAALLTGPAGRLVPRLHRLADASRALLQGFCGGMAVYCALIILPNLVMIPDGIRHQGVTAGMTVFVLFTGGVTMVMAGAASGRLCILMGEKVCGTLLGLSATYFWFCYSLIGLAHISGPHRPDNFYDLSVMLMVLGLLARFADRFAATLQARS